MYQNLALEQETEEHAKSERISILGFSHTTPPDLHRSLKLAWLAPKRTTTLEALSMQPFLLQEPPLPTSSQFCHHTFVSLFTSSHSCCHTFASFEEAASSAATPLSTSTQFCSHTLASIIQGAILAASAVSWPISWFAIITCKSVGTIEMATMCQHVLWRRLYFPEIITCFSLHCSS